MHYKGTAVYFRPVVPDGKADFCTYPGLRQHDDVAHLRFQKYLSEFKKESYVSEPEKQAEKQYCATFLQEL